MRLCRLIMRRWRKIKQWWNPKGSSPRTYQQSCFCLCYWAECFFLWYYPMILPSFTERGMLVVKNEGASEATNISGFYVFHDKAEQQKEKVSLMKTELTLFSPWVSYQLKLPKGNHWYYSIVLLYDNYITGSSYLCSFNYFTGKDPISIGEPSHEGTLSPINRNLFLSLVKKISIINQIEKKVKPQEEFEKFKNLC